MGRSPLSRSAWQPLSASHRAMQKLSRRCRHLLISRLQGRNFWHQQVQILWAVRALQHAAKQS